MHCLDFLNKCQASFFHVKPILRQNPKVFLRVLIQNASAESAESAKSAESAESVECHISFQNRRFGIITSCKFFQPTIPHNYINIFKDVCKVYHIIIISMRERLFCSTKYLT